MIKQVIHVAIDVLAYDDNLLLATRHQDQHQGGKLEFVGGKIEQGETPIHALCREVAEEIGLDISGNLAVKLGRIYHDYGDKQVQLYVYHIELTDEQYNAYQAQTVGLLGQTLAFYKRADVIGSGERFPDANRAILRWLTLPSEIVISQSVADSGSIKYWLDKYCKLAPNALLYIRSQTDPSLSVDLMLAVSLLRADIGFVVTLSDFMVYQMRSVKVNIAFIKLNTAQMWSLAKGELPDIPSNIPLLVSVHNQKEARLCNDLAEVYPIAGAFVSPVKATKTHPDAQAIGWSGLSELGKCINVPVIALGGLTPKDFNKVRQYGAVAVSGIRGFAT